MNNDVHNQKLENPQYWDMLSPEYGADKIVQELMKVLPVGLEVFEYGTGRGRNAIPLAQKGYRMIAQDIGVKAIRDLDLYAKQNNLKILTIINDAREVLHDHLYDAFIVIRLLHFLIENDAMGLIRNMIKYTKIGGYNAFVIFSEDQSKAARFYFPTKKDFLKLYEGWEIISESEEVTRTSEGRLMPRFSILLKKLSHNTL